jgi:hypothetical protein
MRSALIGALIGWATFAGTATAGVGFGVSVLALAGALGFTGLLVAHLVTFSVRNLRAAARRESRPSGHKLTRRQLLSAGVKLGVAALVVAALGRTSAAHGQEGGDPLGCECDKIPVGFGHAGPFDSKTECEEKGLPKAHEEAVGRAKEFCERNYRCVDPQCPKKIFVNPTTAEDCECEGPERGKWHARCFLQWEMLCCCVPEGQPD